MLVVVTPVAKVAILVVATLVVVIPVAKVVIPAVIPAVVILVDRAEQSPMNVWRSLPIVTVWA